MSPRHTAVLVVTLALSSCAGEPAVDTTVSDPTAPEASETTAADTADAGAAPDGRADIDDPAVARIDAFLAERSYDTSLPGWRNRMFPPPWDEITFDDDATYYWELETNKGPLRIRLMPDVAPNHVASTITLTRAGFYDGLTFHRVITGFMAQGGDPAGTGMGGPGYNYAGEFDPEVRHDRPGLLSMANAGPGTDGSQFFITFAKTPHLDGKHTIFGETVSGMKTLQALEQAGSRSGMPSEELVIERATIAVEQG